jgi:ribosomal-protein-alanine N-acetyltransferase
MTEMPLLETERLLIRPFQLGDLTDVHRLMDIELGDADLGADKMTTLAEREQWLRWAVANPEQLAKLRQPPYGDRAIVLKTADRLIGACGYVPCLNPFEQLPGFAGSGCAGGDVRYTTEFGLFYAISPAHQRRGYATEAARALVDYAFQQLRLKRVIATTAYGNTASQGVMRKLGMRIVKNPLPDPPWLQVVGMIENE